MGNHASATKASINIGLRIKKARKKMRITTVDFGKIMEISASSVTHWESGRSAFPAYQLLLIAKKLKVSPAWLLTGEGDMDAGEK